MTRIRLQYGLPLVTVTLKHGGAAAVSDRFVVDTGSGGTLIRSELLEEIGLTPGPNDIVERVRGVGGYEFVVGMTIDSIGVRGMEVARFRVEGGALQYGFELDGILGMDFLMAIGAVIDLSRMELRRARGTRKNA